MGRPIEPVNNGERFVVPAGLLPSDSAAQCYVLRIVGDLCAAEHILDGDYVVIERRTDAQPGEPVVVLIGDEASIKRYYPEGPRVRLEPLDPAMKPIRVPAAEVRIQGVVVGLMRKY